MLYRADIVYSSEGTEKIASDFGVKLHGALMQTVPRSYAESLHRGEIQPFSILATESEGRINLRIRIWK